MVVEPRSGDKYSTLASKDQSAMFQSSESYHFYLSKIKNSSPFLSDSIIFIPFQVLLSNLCEVNSEAPKAEMEDIPINKRTCRSKASSPCIEVNYWMVVYVEWMDVWMSE